MMRTLNILLTLGLIAAVSCSQGEGGGAPAAAPLPNPTVSAAAPPPVGQESAPAASSATDTGVEPLADAATTPTTAEEQSYTRRTPFVPLDDPLFLTAQEGSYLLADDLVLGLEWEGEARAYPVRMLRFHHLVNDTVAGRPLLITY